jgi:SAM-dependent methyltransferase
MALSVFRVHGPGDRKCLQMITCNFKTLNENARRAYRGIMTLYRLAMGYRRARHDPVLLRRIPFSIGITKVWPGTYLSYLPDRYSDRYSEYLKLGGTMRHDDIAKFTLHNWTNNGGDLARFYFLNLVIDQIGKEELDGDIAELGVYKGNTAFIFAEFARSKNKTAYLFDTFQGFPTTDLVGIDANKEMEFDDTSIEFVKSVVGEKNVRFVPGYFPESAAQLPDDLSFCVVHLDCDLYRPFKAALEYFYPRLVPGGFLIMHDYLSLHWDGSEKAVDEFLKNKPEKPIPVADKSGTVVIRKC